MGARVLDSVAGRPDQGWVSKQLMPEIPRGEFPMTGAGLFDTGQGASPRFSEVHLI